MPFKVHRYPFIVHRSGLLVVRSYEIKRIAIIQRAGMYKEVVDYADKAFRATPNNQ